MIALQSLNNLSNVLCRGLQQQIFKRLTTTQGNGEL